MVSVPATYGDSSLFAITKSPVSYALGMDELDEFNEAPHIVHRGDSDTLHSSNGDLAVDDYLDNDDEIETLVLSTDDLLHAGNPVPVSSGGSKPLTLNGNAMNGGLGKGGRSFD